MMQEVGLVLEGGGMRGAYTAGVLDFFLDQGWEFPFVVGASAGACNGTSYISGQRGRNYKVLVEYGSHPDYISYRRALKGKELFGMDFLFDVLPNKLVPFDFEAFFNSATRFVVGATDINTGQPIYLDSFQSKEELLQAIRASSSLPLLAPSTFYKGRELMDGGIADPIPIRCSINAGYKKHIVVLTRNEGYFKRGMKFSWLFRRSYKGYPCLLEALASRHIKYNETIQLIEDMERNGEVFVIRPRTKLKVSRIERKKEKLHSLYEQGYQEAANQQQSIYAFME